MLRRELALLVSNYIRTQRKDKSSVTSGEEL